MGLSFSVYGDWSIDGGIEMKSLVIGAARSGLAIAKLLKQNGYEVTLTDLKQVAEKPVLEALDIQIGRAHV